MLLLPGRYSSSSFACLIWLRSRGCGSDPVRLFKLTISFRDVSLVCLGGECGGEEGSGGSEVRFVLRSPANDDRSMPSNAIGLLLGGSSSPSFALEMSVLSEEGFWAERGIAMLVGAVPDVVPCISRWPRHPGPSSGEDETPAVGLRVHAVGSFAEGHAVSTGVARASRPFMCCWREIARLATMWRCLAGENKGKWERTCRSAPSLRLKLLDLIS